MPPPGARGTVKSPTQGALPLGWSTATATSHGTFGVADDASCDERTAHVTRPDRPTSVEARSLSSTSRTDALPTGPASGLVLPVNPSSVRLGRRIVMAYLDVARVHHDVNTVLLLVTELLVNAVDRSLAPFHFFMCSVGDSLHVETRDERSADDSLGPAKVVEADDQERQLRMIMALSDRWGVDLFLTDAQRYARVVWFEYVPKRRVDDAAPPSPSPT